MDDSSDEEPPKQKKPIKPTENELSFRKKKYHDFADVLEDSIHCTVCSADLKHAVTKGETLHFHPLLEVLLCKACREFYGLGELSSDEDGYDKFCRFCAQGGKLYCCYKSTCTSAFCHKCLKRNLDENHLKLLKKDDWECLVCDPKPIYNQRAVCQAAIRFVQQKKHEKIQKRKGKLELLVMKKKNGDALPRANRVRTREARKNCSSDEVVEEIPHSSKMSFNVKRQKGNLSGNGCDVLLPQGHLNTKVSQRVNKSQLQPMSSFEFSDSDFEPKHLQKPIKKEKILAGGNDKKEVIKKVKDNRNKNLHNETIAKKVKQQYVVLDGLADDIDCIGRMLTDRTDRFKKKYFSGKDCPEVMIPVIRQKMLRLAEVSVQSLSQLMKDLMKLEESSETQRNINSSSNVEEECEKRQVLQTSSRSGSENELAENSDDKIGNIEQTSTRSISENELAENSDDTIENIKQTSQNDLDKDSDDGVTNVKRCGSMTSDDEVVISVPNERLVNSNLTDSSIVNCNSEADNEGPDKCHVPNGEMERDETDAMSTSSIHSGKTVLNQSLDLFDDSGLEEQNFDSSKTSEAKNASVPLSSQSLASKAKLLACSDDDCDSESSNTTLKLNSSKNKPGPACSKSFSKSSESESEICKSMSKKNSNFSITDLEIYNNDTKLQGTWNVKIEKMDKSREQEYFQLVGDYYKKDSKSSDSDSSVDRLTRLSNLRRSKRNGCRDDVSKVAPAHTSKEAEKKSDGDNKVTLQDFYGQSEEEDIESEMESNHEISSKKVEDKVKTRNEFYKAKLLMSSDSEDVLSENGTEEDDEVKVSATSPNHGSSKHSDPPSGKDDIKDGYSSPPDDHSTNETPPEKRPESKKKDWRQNRLLTMKLSDSDTDDDERRWDKKKSKQGSDESDKKKDCSGSIRKRVGRSKSETSDSEMSCQQIDSSSSDDFVKKKRKRPSKKSSSLSSSESDSKKTEKKKVRKRIKVIKSSSSDDESSASEKEDSPNKGRKKIRRVIKEEDLGENTKFAAREEEERRKRIEERNKKFNEIYDDIQKNIEVVDKLVLDFDEETRQPLVEVDRELVKKLKPHQAKGVKFMWDACFESIQRIKKSNGSGCILAHCMGLGKSLQVVTLLHTLFNHPETKVHTALIVCPLSTVLNWVNEFEKWLDNLHNGHQVAVFDLTRQKQNYERQYRLKEWQEEGGVMVLGYEMYRNLSNPESKRVRASILKTFQATLVNPGPDIVVCDEGHLLKNEDTAISKAMSRVKTLRRVVLTGTPLQNNLKEYHCMVQFVKPNLLGTRREFLNRFVNPITNGQFEDSTAHDVRTMKRRAHVLHKTLEGSVQRYDYSVLTPFLPTKQEYVISVRLTELQETLYKHFLDNYSSRGIQGKGAQLFNDFQNFQRIWTHPRVLKMSAERNEIKAEKLQQDEDSEGSLRDFIDDGDETSTDGTSSQSSSSDNDVQCLDDDNAIPKQKTSRRLRSNKDQEDPEPIALPDETRRKEWWQAFVKNEDFEDLEASPKLVLLFSILKECEEVGDKLLVFSQSLFSLDLIEYFLEKIDDANQNGSQDESLNKIKGSWAKGIDFFRLDGQTPTELRSIWCKNFNNEENLRGRLFLISTRAGGLGINLVAANRVIIFDASWNPSHDVQSIFRVYRFGQKKPCFIYRFLAQGTMEEKIYERQVTKLSLACRVVDEQQIERHYNMADLQELYRFTPADRNVHEKPKLPKDGLFAEILKAHEDLITSYHEHDSLLENKEDEELNEEERQAAWEEYENEKKGKLNALLPTAGPDPLPTVEQLREYFRVKDPALTDNALEERVRNVYQQIIQANRQKQLKLQEQQLRQQQAYFRQQQLQQMQQMQILQQSGQLAGFPLPQAQYMQYQATTNPAFLPLTSQNPYGSLPSTSFGPTGTQNFQ